MQPMSVYIAGPMRGIPQHNFPAFDTAKTRLQDAGYFVTSPADLDRSLGIEADIRDEEFSNDLLRSCMKLDTTAITRCTHLALLPGWEESSGCRPEIVLANLLGLEFIDAETLKPIEREAAVLVVGARLVAGAYQKHHANIAENDLTRLN